jgi:hypothetical protein
MKKLHASKGSIQHQMAKQDNVLDRLTHVAMRGWPEYRETFWVERCDSSHTISNNTDGFMVWVY